MGLYEKDACAQSCPSRNMLLLTDVEMGWFAFRAFWEM